MNVAKVGTQQLLTMPWYDKVFFSVQKKILIVSLQVGMLTLMSAVLKHNPVFKHQPEGQVFVATLFEFLFKLPSSQVLVLTHTLHLKVANKFQPQTFSKLLSGEAAPSVQVSVVTDSMLRLTWRACSRLCCQLYCPAPAAYCTTSGGIRGKDLKYNHDDLSGGQPQVVPLGVLAQGGGSQRMRPRGSPQLGSHVLHGDGRPAAVHDPSDEGVYTARRRTRSNRPHLWQAPVHSL